MFKKSLSIIWMQDFNAVNIFWMNVFSYLFNIIFGAHLFASLIKLYDSIKFVV